MASARSSATRASPCSFRNGASAGPRRGSLHRAPRARRLLRLRRPRARVHARARADRVGEARAARSSALVPRWMGSKMALSTSCSPSARASSSPTPGAANSRRPRCSACGRCSTCSRAGRRCPASASGWSSASRRAKATASSSIRSRAGSRTSVSRRCSRIGCRATRRARSASPPTTTASGCCRREPVPLSLGELGRLLAAPDVEATSSRASTPPSSGAASSARSRASRGSSSRAIPGEPHPTRQLQASSALLYDVFAEYDRDNPLLAQAVREVLERQLEAPRLAAALDAPARQRARCSRDRARPTPFAFPLMVEIFREKLSTEALETRVARMVAELEEAANALLTHARYHRLITQESPMPCRHPVRPHRKSRARHRRVSRPRLRHRRRASRRPARRSSSTAARPEALAAAAKRSTDAGLDRVDRRCSTSPTATAIKRGVDGIVEPRTASSTSSSTTPASSAAMPLVDFPQQDWDDDHRDQPDRAVPRLAGGAAGNDRAQAAARSSTSRR